MNSKSSFASVLLLAYVPLVAIIFFWIIFFATIIANLFSNFFVLLFLVALLSSTMPPLIIILSGKFGLIDPFEFDLEPYFYMFVKPWSCYTWIYRRRHPQRSFKAEELSQETIDAIKNSTMDPKHNHLNTEMDFDDEKE